jgi:uncharacterized NAD(P)/FAD-binding protein YdhS
VAGNWHNYKMDATKKRIGLLGGGPSALFMYKRLIEATNHPFEIDIFERKNHLGAGMPYSREGALHEHITNVSANEIPDIVTPMSEWIHTVPDLLSEYNIVPDKFNEYKVLPRLLFGKYLEDQFGLLLRKSAEKGIKTTVHLQSEVVDITDNPKNDSVSVTLKDSAVFTFDTIVVCTGHNWPKKQEDNVKGYFDSPYPPSKLELKLNNAVAIRGSSLTAIDAIRTLARNNGHFQERGDGMLQYIPDDGSENFKMVMHSRSGLLPAVRFHLEDTHLKNDSLLTPEDITAHRLKNNGYLSLDYVFEKDFKELFKDKDIEFYERIKDMDIEAFVEAMMALRERLDPFVLLRAEYAEAEKSIKRHESVYWKEMLAVLSFAMNYPAKYLSAEDMMRLKKTLMPLISIVIAFVPQTSCRELLALHDAGKLDIVCVGGDSTVDAEDNGGITYKYIDDEGNMQSVHYQTFVDSIGQPHVGFKDFPFKGLIQSKAISPALLKFRDNEEGQKLIEKGNDNVQKLNDDYYLQVPGIAINDDFQVVDAYGAYNKRVYIMAVPYIGGYNPDYSGLDFSEAASARIIKSLETGV